VTDAGFAIREKSAPTFGETLDAACGEIWDGGEDLAARELAAGISIRRTRLNSTTIFHCVTIFRDLDAR
jgi:hypothetical protein